MASTNSPEYANYIATPRVMQAPNTWGGQVRKLGQAIITLASQGSGDTINFFPLFKGQIPLFGILKSDTSLGSSTLAIGVSGTAAKYRAAATFTATETPTPFGKTAVMNVALVADEVVIGTIGAAALPSSGTLIVELYGHGP